MTFLYIVPSNFAQIQWGEANAYSASPVYNGCLAQMDNSWAPENIIPLSVTSGKSHLPGDLPCGCKLKGLSNVSQALLSPLAQT